VHRVTSHSNDGGVQAFAQERQHAQPPLAVIPARVLYGNSRFPVQLRHQFKRQAALFCVASILGRIERDAPAYLLLQRKMVMVKEYWL
jgi:hypothetical protein